MRPTLESRSCCFSCGPDCKFWPANVRYNLPGKSFTRIQNAGLARHSVARPTIVCGAAGVALQTNERTSTSDTARLIKQWINRDDMRELLQRFGNDPQSV